MRVFSQFILFLAILATAPGAGQAASAGTSDEQLRCLALTVYWEARSLSREAQLAVAHVVLNRVASDEFPPSICEVVREGGETLDRCQFSWWCDGKPDEPANKEAWEQAVEIARSALEGESADPADGALYYHTEDIRPSWTSEFTATVKIGDHLFYR